MGVRSSRPFPGQELRHTHLPLGRNHGRPGSLCCTKPPTGAACTLPSPPLPSPPLTSPPPSRWTQSPSRTSVTETTTLLTSAWRLASKVTALWPHPLCLDSWPHPLPPQLKIWPSLLSYRASTSR